MTPHLFVYDSELEQLECHRFDLDSQSTVVRIGVRLGHIVHCYSVSETGILIASRGDRPSRSSGLDLFEWIPDDQKLLLAHLEADSIVGVSDSLPGRPWYILYTHLGASHRVSATLGTTIMKSTLSRDTLPSVYQINAIPTEYRNNLRKCYMQGNTLATLDTISECKRIWAHTQSDELVFMEDGALQWSANVSQHRTRPDSVYVFTRKRAPGSTMHFPGYYYMWSQDVLLADVREAGLDTAVGLPRHTRQRPMECDLYPAVGFTRSKAVTDATDESKARVKINLDSALGTLEEQLALKQKRTERLQASLVSKKEIVQSCQDIMSGSLRSALFSGLGPRVQEDSALLKRKRDQRRKRLLERLVPIVGRTVATSFQAEFNDRGPEKDKDEPLDILECTAGWMTSASRDAIWLGVKVKNISDQALFHLRLSVAQQNSRGRSIPRLESQAIDVVLGTIEVDTKMLGDDEILDRSKALARILNHSVLLHHSSQEGQDNSGSLSSSTVLVPAFTRQDTPPAAWRRFLDEMLLPARVVCCLGDLSRSRIARLLQDGFGLSLSIEDHKEQSRFGSVEEDMAARIVSSTVAKTEREGEEETSTEWQVYFYTPTEVLATVAARKAVLLSRRFQ
ncbi:hypothetical protein BGW39_009745 [Mortierella sp. 14UC]|nr:hypothetical protein BGW39_009745 [Mortierella sp. 14UC]